MYGALLRQNLDIPTVFSQTVCIMFHCRFHHIGITTTALLYSEKKKSMFSLFRQHPYFCEWTWVLMTIDHDRISPFSHRLSDL